MPDHRRAIREERELRALRLLEDSVRRTFPHGATFARELEYVSEVRTTPIATSHHEIHLCATGTDDVLYRLDVSGKSSAEIQAVYDGWIAGLDRSRFYLSDVVVEAGR
jgi:hypothetical protein